LNLELKDKSPRSITNFKSIHLHEIQQNRAVKKNKTKLNRRWANNPWGRCGVKGKRSQQGQQQGNETKRANN